MFIAPEPNQSCSVRRSGMYLEESVSRYVPLLRTELMIVG
jgi:hypothetical protein